MADALVDGNTRVAFVAAIASPSAPTTTELNAGLLIQTFLTPDGLMGLEPDTTKSNTSSLASVWGTENKGQINLNNMLLRLKKQTGTDTAYTTLAYGVTGYLVVRRNGVAETTAWTAAQAVNVYPIICLQRRSLTPESSAVEKYEVPLALTSAPSLDAAVA